MPAIPEFSSYQEREKWLVANATHFTIVRRANRKTYRAEKPTLEQALAGARSIAKAHPTVRLLIYAIYGVHDCWCATVSKDGTEGPHHASRNDPRP